MADCVVGVAAGGSWVFTAGDVLGVGGGVGCVRGFCSSGRKVFNLNSLSSAALAAMP